MAGHDVNAFLSVKTQFENVGDALITRELVNLTAVNAKTFVDLSRCPPSFRVTLGLEEDEKVTSYVKLGSLKLLGMMLRSRLTGRTTFYFLPPGGRGEELSLGEYLRGRAANVLLGFLNLIGVRICHIGISYDHLGPRHASLVRARTRHLAVHAVRDRLTAKHLEALGVRVDDILPDLAVNRFPAPAKGSRTGPETVAFSFRRDKYLGRARTIVDAAREVVAELPSHSRVKVVSQVARDEPFMRELCDALNGRGDVMFEFHSCHSSITMCQEVYADCDRIYSNRLHALLLAASVGVLPIALVDADADAKIVGTLEHLGLDKHIVRAPWTGVARVSPPEVDQARLAREADRLRRSLSAILSDARPARRG